MSLKALSWAFDTEVESSTQKLVLLALSNFASDQGKTYPSVETLRNLTQMDDKTIRTALKGLEKLGHILDTEKRVGVTKQVKVYQLPSDACHCHKVSENGYLNGRKTGERLEEDTQKRVAEPVPSNRTNKSLKRFIKPTQPEMELYASKIGLPVTEIGAFYDHHEQRGWKFRGGVPMASWEAAMRTWKTNYFKWNQKEAVEPEQDPNDWMKSL